MVRKRQNGGTIGVENIPTLNAASGTWSLNEVYGARKDAIWPLKFVATGGTETTFTDSNGQDWKVHKFLETADFTVVGFGVPEADILLVAGGGGSSINISGGGGGGGVVYVQNAYIPAGVHQMQVGGGAPYAVVGDTLGKNGSVTTAFGATVYGGGGGGIWANGAGFDGGSGGGSSSRNDSTGVLSGGASQDPITAGSILESGNITFYGEDGGSSTHNYSGTGGTGWVSASGGGGAGGIGGGGAQNSSGYDGGAGVLINMDGNDYYWAGGGGGANFNVNSSTNSGGDGGIGGGGGGMGQTGYGAGGGSAINAGQNASSGNAGNGGENSGGGGGGQLNNGDIGGKGGAGIIIIRYRIS